MKTSEASSSRRPATRRAAPADPAAVADALFRCALECCRQHQRYASLVDRDALDAEQLAARTLVGCCDGALMPLMDAYAAAVSASGAAPNEAWRRDANRLWSASREWLRRRQEEDGVRVGGRRRTPGQLAGLAVEYDLAASALLLLQQAVDAYARSRPEAAMPSRRM